jgi:hypothetical protein
MSINSLLSLFLPLQHAYMHACLIILLLMQTWSARCVCGSVCSAATSPSQASWRAPYASSGAGRQHQSAAANSQCQPIGMLLQNFAKASCSTHYMTWCRASMHGCCLLAFAALAVHMLIINLLSSCSPTQLVASGALLEAAYEPHSECALLCNGRNL